MLNKQSKEVKVVAGAFNKVVLDVVELAKQGWDVEKGNSITLIGGSMKVLLCKENVVDTKLSNSNKLDGNTSSKPKISARKRQTKEVEYKEQYSK